MEIFTAGAWRTVSRVEVFTGSSWRRVLRAESYNDGVWRNALSFVRPMTVTANPVLGSDSSLRPIRVTSEPSVATPTGGVGPYSYFWQITAGNAVIDKPTLASTEFYQVLDSGRTSFSAARVTCTDSLGTTATAVIEITLENVGNL